ncbi:MAG: chromate transporter [Rikenellaceae bacterium]
MEIKERDTKYSTLFTSFLKIGLFTIGGGYAMIPLIQREVVNKQGWINKDDFIGLLTIAQSVPGPIALNSAAFVGYKSRGYLGALVALLGIVVPAFTVILTVALFFSTIRENAVVEAAFRAMRPVVVALILAPTIALMKGLSPLMIGFTILSMALFALHLTSPAVLILSAIVIAILWTYKMRKELRK